MRKHRSAICGAGMVGIATAFYLSARKPGCGVVLIDKFQPMALTTGHSGGNRRDTGRRPACQPALDTGSARWRISRKTGKPTAACAAGESWARWILEKSGPAYAGHFHPDRCRDPDIAAAIEAPGSGGRP